jgi:cell division control protein 12
LTEVEIIKAELEEKQFKAKLSVIDTPGFGDYVNNRDSWSPIVDFIDDQHEAYMRQEQQPLRTDKTDLRVHACLYFIRPTGHTSVPFVYACFPRRSRSPSSRLKPLDIEIMKRLGTRVNLIPVIAKADTLTQNDLYAFKQRVRNSPLLATLTLDAHIYPMQIREVIAAQGIRIYQPPIDTDDEAAAENARVLLDAMPFPSSDPLKMLPPPTAVLSRDGSTFGELQRVCLGFSFYESKAQMMFLQSRTRITAISESCGLA